MIEIMDFYNTNNILLILVKLKVLLFYLNSIFVDFMI